MAIRRNSNSGAWNWPSRARGPGSGWRERLPLEFLCIQDRREDARRSLWRQPNRCLQELRGSDCFEVEQVQLRMAARDAHHERNNGSGRGEADPVGKLEHRAHRSLLLVDRQVSKRP